MKNIKETREKGVPKPSSFIQKNKITLPSSPPSSFIVLVLHPSVLLFPSSPFKSSGYGVPNP
jgi:hypothetical protein